MRVTGLAKRTTFKLCDQPRRVFGSQTSITPCGAPPSECNSGVVLLLQGQERPDQVRGRVRPRRPVPWTRIDAARKFVPSRFAAPRIAPLSTLPDPLIRAS